MQHSCLGTCTRTPCFLRHSIVQCVDDRMHCRTSVTSVIHVAAVANGLSERGPVLRKGTREYFTREHLNARKHPSAAALLYARGQF